MVWKERHYWGGWAIDLFPLLLTVALFSLDYLNDIQYWLRYVSLGLALLLIVSGRFLGLYIDRQEYRLSQRKYWRTESYSISWPVIVLIVMVSTCG